MKTKTKLALLLLLLAALVMALPAMAFPPPCTCSYCSLNTTSCTLISTSGNTVISCGYYYPHYCEGPA